MRLHRFCPSLINEVLRPAATSNRKAATLNGERHVQRSTRIVDYKRQDELSTLSSDAPRSRLHRDAYLQVAKAKSDSWSLASLWLRSGLTHYVAGEPPDSVGSRRLDEPDLSYR
jgi:hypothetical protein